MEKYYIPRYGKELYEQLILPNVLCFDSSTMQLESEQNTVKFKSIVAIFENCRDYEESADNCASVDDTNAYWDSITFGEVFMVVNMLLKQVVLKDMEDPIKSIRPFVVSSLSGDTSDFVDYQIVEMAPNEFTSF